MPTIISFHTLHDANVCICKDGQVLVALELETNKEYVIQFDTDNDHMVTIRIKQWSSCGQQGPAVGTTRFHLHAFQKFTYRTKRRRPAFTSEWKKAIDVVTQFTKIKSFDIAVTTWVQPSQIAVLKTLVHAEKWVTAKYHVSHAHIGFYDSPFNRALILSADGGGNDGVFNVYVGEKGKGLQLIKAANLRLGSGFRQATIAMREITGGEYDPDNMTTYTPAPPLAYAGKVMGYAALGKVRQEWLPAMFFYYEHYISPLHSLHYLGEETGLGFEPNSLSNEDARDVAATSQYVFNQLMSRSLAEYLKLIQGPIDGVVMTGGCALNVIANEFLVEKFGYPLHVCSASNDCGISVGAAWSLEPPKKHQNLQYIGLPCWDTNILQNLIQNRHPEKVTVPELAQLLLNGTIIGVVRGRQEFGPRALGHRSMLCYPNKPELKDKLNKLKGREWYRPLCPSVAIESVPRLFLGRKTAALKQKLENIEHHPARPACCVPNEDGDPDNWIPASPYMSFAPFLNQEGQDRFPAICHFDGKARLQTVSASDDAWYHELLTEIGRHNGGFGILLNTSFNVKGKPILNDISKALDILDTSPEGSFDHVLIDDWLFKPQRDGSVKSDATESKRRCLDRKTEPKEMP